MTFLFVLALSCPDIHFPCTFLQLLPGGFAGICRPAETFSDTSASWMNSFMQLWLVSFKIKFQFTQVSQTPELALLNVGKAVFHLQNVPDILKPSSCHRVKGSHHSVG